MSILSFVVGLGVGALAMWLAARATHAPAHGRVEREQLVAAAVDTAVKVASASLDARLADGSRELGLRSEAFGEQARSIDEQLGRVQRLVAELQIEKAVQHGELVAQMRSAADRSRELHETTAQLHKVLASSPMRGQWGERLAEDVLSAAGFVKGVNYVTQRALPGGGIPDFTFVLPRGLELNMDVKFPVDNYVRFLEAGDDNERERARAAFCRDVRSRVREIRDRGYIQADRTVDTVLLFIPNESVYAFMHESDVGLVGHALGEKVVLCSPLTLFSVLAIIRQAVDNFRLERRSSEILDFLVGFRSEWERFTDHLDKTTRQFETFQRSFEGLGSTRRNQLERNLRRIDDLESTVRPASDVHDGRPMLVATPPVAAASDLVEPMPPSLPG